MLLCCRGWSQEIERIKNNNIFIRKATKDDIFTDIEKRLD